MTSRSRYDELHDHYHLILTTKSGTRYERLAALVFKALEQQNVVIHNLELKGEGEGVKHQIDVSIETGGVVRRIILECKDFDRSEDKVGLGIVRDFRSVIEDTGAEEGWIVTCNGFTADAAAYAKSKNIKLLVLRLFEESDWEGRIQKIVLGLHAIFATNHRIDLAISDADRVKLAAAMTSAGIEGGFHLTDPVFVVGPQTRAHFNSFVSEGARMFMPPMDECVEGQRVAFCLSSLGAGIEIAGQPPVPFDGVRGDFEIGIESHESEIVSQRVAEMLLQGFAGTDLVIFGDQLERYVIDSQTGVTAPR